MRKVTREITEAFLDGIERKIGNSCTRNEVGDSRLYLHGNNIACHVPGWGIYLNHQGWMTPTTKERLNGILEMLGRGEDRIYQSNFVWYWKGKEEFKSGWNKI